MRVVLTLLCLVALAGCGGSDDAATTAAPPAAGAPIAGGGLSVQEAIDSELEGPLMVRGYVIANVDEYRLCEAILESDPPQCGEPSLRIEGVAPADLRPLSDAQKPVSLLGDVEDGAIRVSETSLG